MWLELLKSSSIILFEAFCCKNFLDIFLERKFSHKFTTGIFVVILMGIIFVLGSVTDFQGSLFVFRYFAVVFGIYLVSVLFYSGKWQKRLFVCGAFYAILYAVDFCVFIISDTWIAPQHLENAMVQIVLSLFSRIIMFLIILFIGYLCDRGKEMQLEETSWLFMMCFPIFSMAIMLTTLFSFERRGGATGFLLISFVMLLANVVMFEGLKYISKRNAHWNQIRVMQEKNEEKIRLYQEISISDREQKNLLHDYYNQISCVRGLLQNGQNKEAEEYLEKLTGSFSDHTESVDVNHPIINVVLNQKYRLAKMKHISILFYANDLSDLWLEEQDIVSLLSNLLDNAIEACEKIENEAGRTIYVKLIREEKQFVLSIRNTVHAPVDVSENGMATDKPDKKWHGLGMRNVQMILDKYNGICMMRYEEGSVYYTAIIPEM